MSNMHDSQQNSITNSYLGSTFTQALKKPLKLKNDMNNDCDSEELKEILDYDKETGIFTWKNSYSRRGIKGSVAGTPDKKGYVIIRINKFGYKAHRLAWLYVYGEFPNGILDHINRVKNDNRISNLRICTYSENLQNSDIAKDNSSGYKGVGWCTASKKWRSYIAVDRKTVGLGRFDNLSDAVQARKQAELNYHPFAVK